MHKVWYNPFMATTTDLRDALVKAGVDQDAAIEIQRRLQRRSGPSAMSILVGATAAGFGLLAIGIGWVKSDVGELRTRIDSVETRLASDIHSLSERLTRIETLLDERLPDKR